MSYLIIAILAFVLGFVLGVISTASAVESVGLDWTEDIMKKLEEDE